MLDSVEPVKRAREREREGQQEQQQEHFGKRFRHSGDTRFPKCGAFLSVCLSVCHSHLLWNQLRIRSLFLSTLQNEWALGVHKTANISITTTKLNEATNRILEQFTINYKHTNNFEPWQLWQKYEKRKEKRIEM